MAELCVTAGPFVFEAHFERAAAPRSCAAVSRLLPLESRIIHVRWSGDAVWIPLGQRDLGLPFENNTSYPAPGQAILYPGGVSECEILIAYGSVRVASKAGQLSGNHFMTLTSGLDRLAELGRLVLWQGAQPIRIALA
jgi:hypothetical protein